MVNLSTTYADLHHTCDNIIIMVPWDVECQWQGKLHIFRFNNGALFCAAPWHTRYNIHMDMPNKLLQHGTNVVNNP